MIVYSALRHSHSLVLAVAAPATFVLCPESLSVDLDPKITRTLAVENQSLQPIPMRYVIYC
jgi:hypothetical protein